MIHEGMPRSEVLMTLGNPNLATPDYKYLGYQSFEKTFDILGIFVVFFPGAEGVGVDRLTGNWDEHVFMLAFDADGKVSRMSEFSGRAASTLRADIKDWIGAKAGSAR